MLTSERTTRLAKSLNLEALTESERGAVLASMGELVFKDALVRCLESLSPADRAAFAALPDADPEAVTRFLAEKVPDAGRFVEAAAGELTDDILSATQDS
jgi:hypothetical protein